MNDDSDQIRVWKHEDRVPYHLQQFEVPYRSTVYLAEFIQSLISLPQGDALDVACGAGANIFYLSQQLKGYRWTGIDIAGDILFESGRKYFSDHHMDVTFVEGDFYKLTEIFPGRKFDLVLSIQTLMGIPEYENAVDQLLAITRGWLFITTLLTDFPVDAKIQVMDYSYAIDCQGPFYYNVYSLSRLRAYCEKLGCKQFESQDFDIDIDLPLPEKYAMTTYTKTLADGKRIQLSGPLHMPWKFVGIRMGNQ